ncbi:UDP-3-O-acyl-N-acetylglucosamine deacetylase [Helicobacter mustelae]|uniref:UDP-3-O-acyl-N-acetylglucosamine deacetylase n=1 Tax=Helicobacter mustelae (strain ATCC 43772 / CCUG 25715 / CIP 103759 / LMG 18044 / NCTC 12198 / R85-136P) TaxID=679897 RepID=D3UG14_HELM1|nr:UDP-3-O-acyl-N-acetylglucosamine deacetylase [Helicobacter mustelae]CBG39435.1 UDP-3-O-[3-hydroxymyristoyl] n-acetylglucosamine deacetylase [Helicobacter mustelae 12198]SQH70947.1 UDP-3-O-[3-hydroxymyristoyl] n-acetylglucosamine deacetylase [Helicobacter mustelae]
MRQKTIGKKVELVGIGLHKGVPVKMVLEPLEENSGVVFYRSDLGVSIPMQPKNVTNTQMATVLSLGEGKVSTIEHLLSSIYAYGIDNLRISVDNEEIPIMDGSAIGYCMLLEEAGVAELDANKKIMAIKKPIEVRDNEKFVRIEPSNQTVFDFAIDFPHPAIKQQKYKFVFSKEGYKEEIARARTFGFLQEVNYLRSIGLGLGGNLNNCIVLDESGILNKGGLRYKEEFVRHKILDAIGDMAILGMPLLGSYVSFAGSHKLNAMLTQKILEENGAYELVEAKDLENSFAFSKEFA